MTRLVSSFALGVATVVVLCGIGKCGLFGPSVGEKLQVASAPEGATVKIGGVDMGKTPLTLTDLDVEEGQTQTLVFVLDGYLDKEQSVTWTQAEQSVAVTLEAAQKERVFTVKTVPSGAKVYVDGLEKGETPTTFSSKMKDGEEFNLLLQRKGYDDVSRKVKTDAETVITIDVNFKRPGGKANATLDEVLTETEKKWKTACKTIPSDVCSFSYQIGSSGNVTDVDSIKCNYGPITNCTKRMVEKMVFPTDGSVKSDEYKFKGSN